MPVLAILFILGIFSLAFFYLKQKNPMNVALPNFNQTVTPTSIQSLPTISLEDPYSQKGLEIIKNLNNINSDADNIKKEDFRLTPPFFYIENDISE